MRDVEDARPSRARREGLCVRWPTMSGSVPRLKTGEIVLGKYKVEGALGGGGMGEVFRATHLVLHSRVAIKVLRKSQIGTSDGVARLVREARSLAQISSAHVCRVLDVEAIPDRGPALVMELLEGNDLRTELSREGRIPYPRAVRYVLEACDALAEAHDLGIVHRDLKPANLFVVKRAPRPDYVKVLDFGLAKALGGVDGISTLTGDVLGSPRYMSPEQIFAPAGVDGRSDVWSLGVILYELVAGVHPFHADNVMQVTLNIRTAQPTLLAPRAPDVPAGLEEVVARCLTKDREQRYPNAEALAHALAPYAEVVRTSLASLPQHTAKPAADSVAIPILEGDASLAVRASTLPQPPAPIAAAPEPTTRSTPRGGGVVWALVGALLALGVSTALFAAVALALVRKGVIVLSLP